MKGSAMRWGMGSALMIALMGGAVAAQEFGDRPTIETTESETTEPLVAPAPDTDSEPKLDERPEDETQSSDTVTTPRQGRLRVGNRTPYPVRIVVLSRRASTPENAPAHWDFAPGEGGSEGLTLSLQEREPLTIHPGDIIVAFTIDGSRRYWGPNIVDETLAPFWNEGDRSWTMILQP